MHFHAQHFHERWIIDSIDRWLIHRLSLTVVLQAMLQEIRVSVRTYNKDGTDCVTNLLQVRQPAYLAVVTHHGTLHTDLVEWKGGILCCHFLALSEISIYFLSLWLDGDRCLYRERLESIFIDDGGRDRLGLKRQCNRRHNRGLPQ